MPHFSVPTRHRRQAQRMRKNLTAAELTFWNAVRAHRLMGLGFRRQMPIAGFIADFAFPDHKLIVEIDGPSHSLDRHIAKDTLRNQKLETLGWKVLRLGNDDVLHKIDDVCLHVLRMIGMDHFE